MALSILILAAGQHEADDPSPVYLAEHGDTTVLEIIFEKCPGMRLSIQLILQFEVRHPTVKCRSCR